MEITKTKSSIQKETDSQIVGVSLGYNVGISIIEKDTRRMTSAQITNEELIEFVKWVSESPLKKDMEFLIPDFKALQELKSSRKVIANQGETIGDLINRNEHLRNVLKSLHHFGQRIIDDMTSGDSIIKIETLDHFAKALQRVEKEIEI